MVFCRDISLVRCHPICKQGMVNYITVDMSWIINPSLDLEEFRWPLLA